MAPKMGEGGQIWLKCITGDIIMMIRDKNNIFERVENFHADLAWNYPGVYAQCPGYLRAPGGLAGWPSGHLPGAEAAMLMDPGSLGTPCCPGTSHACLIVCQLAQHFHIEHW